ncbi:GGDEF domain-containing protein [Desulfovibrio sp. SGI.169]|uniref:GGDEF domain-containing protein n=1 Tax=Desulfovibrio sp. SGI.169 TaxID=3420561 RepID=UPI003CFC438B
MPTNDSSTQLASIADRSAELLDFVTDVLTRNSAREEGISEKLQDIEGIEELHALLWDIRNLTYALGKGDLKYACKSKGCVVGALKTLQANLSHLTWQTQRIANGEYQHRVNFMGEFSTAFNQMVEALDENVSSLVRLSQKYKEMSAKDPLTGLYNRRAFESALMGILEDVGKKEFHASIIMTDIDLFKKVNDTYGHASGDTVLRAFAEKISAMLRPHDLFCRYGGEEFVILLPGASLKGGMAVAQRLCRGVEGMAIPIEGVEIRITASFGVSSFVASLLQSEKRNMMTEFDAAVKRADDCLYQAKNAGRNTVVCEKGDAPA